MVDKGVDPKAIQGRAVALHSDTGTQQVWQTSMPEELYPTSYVADEAVSFLKSHKQRKDPFLLKVSFPDPHHPFTPPGKYWDMYDPADMELPSTFWDDHQNSLPGFKAIVENRGDRPGLMMPFSPTEAQYRQMAAAEYGMITMIDDAVGQILQTLEETGQADDTIVVFTSDHGDMFGDHGLMLKVAMHFEACLRVPLFIAGPGIAKGRAGGLVSSLDICPTLIGLMGLRPFYGIAGRDLAPILADDTNIVRDFALVEEEQVFPDPATNQLIDMRSVITPDARLTVHRGDHLVGELFDLRNDPDETHNIWDDPGAGSLRADMMERLAFAMIAETRPGEKPKAQA
jgi:arylsulfatase A-like enzyme